MTGKDIAYRAALAAAFLACVAGCSALKVDVDVYKGPLANEKEVQVEQTAVMATGAKPILIALRDQLEWPNCDLAAKRQEAERAGWYMSGFIRPGPDNQSPLKQEPARRVNDVLSLYEGRASGGLAPAAEAVRQSLADYRRSIYAFRPVDTKAAREQWAQIEKGFWPSLKKDKGKLDKNHPALKSLDGKEVLKMADDVRTLRDAYRVMLTTNVMSSDTYADVAVLTIHSRIHGSLKDIKGNGALVKDPALSENELLFGLNPADILGNLQFKALCNEQLLNAHAQLLFRESSDDQSAKQAKELFKSRVKATAQEFFTARASLANMWRRTLVFVQLANSSSAEDCGCADGDPTGRDSYSAYRARCTSASAELIMKTTEPYCLLGVLTVATAHPNRVPPVIRYFSRAMQDRMGQKGYKDFFAGDKEPSLLNDSLWIGAKSIRYQEAEEPRNDILADRKRVKKEFIGALGDELVANPMTTAQALLASDDFYRSGKVVAAGVQDVQSPEARHTAWTAATALPWDYMLAERRTYGLVHGPVLSPTATSEILVKQLGDMVEGVACGYAGGFEHGRLDEGIDTLIERYLKVLQQSPTGDDPARDVQLTALMEEMAHFAEKLLYVANSQTLLGGDQTQTRKYTTVLQAVGNSILVEVNELVCGANHYWSLDRRGESEALAIAEAQSSTPLATLGSLLEYLQAQYDTKKAELKQIESAASASDKGQTGSVESTGPAAGTPRGHGGSQAQHIESTANASGPAKAVAYESTDAATEVAKSGNGLKAAGEGKAETRPEARHAQVNSTDNAAASERQGQIGNLKKSIAQCDAAIASVRGYVKDSASEIPADEKMSPQETITLLLAYLAGKESAERDKNRKGDLKAAIQRVEDYQRRLAPVITVDAQNKSAKDVLDQLIAALQEQYIQKVRSAGKGDAGAKRIQEAIDAAYTYRSGMVYIRPSSAYLRSSYPASSLQPGSTVAWRNMLDDQVLRTLPFGLGNRAANYSVYGHNASETIETADEIDRQSWQNINSVRVTGAGDTNYVVAKDDIGNWYVKGYSADSTSITTAAIGLAKYNLSLYNLGQRSALNVQSTSALASTASTAPGNSSSASGNSSSQETTLEQLVKDYQTNCNNQAQAEYDALSSLLKGDDIQRDVKAAWTAADLMSTDAKSKALNEALKEAATVLNVDSTAAAKATIDSTNPADKLVADLNAIKSFYSALPGEIGTIPDATLSLSEREKAIASAKRVVRDRLTSLIDQRLAAIRQFETEMVLLGRATNSADSGSTKAAKK